MKPDLLMDFSINRETNTITVKKEFMADVPVVWEAFTNPEILDQWWAPTPWKTRTKTMDFREGGRWLYVMEGPAGEQHWCFASYLTIQPHEKVGGLDGFCDADGNVNPDMPQSKWGAEFSSIKKGTLVVFQMKYDDLAQLEATVQMGFEEGFGIALKSLDEIFEAKFAGKEN